MSISLVQRLRFDATRCETTFSKGVAGNIEEAADKIERLRAALQDIAFGIGEKVLAQDEMRNRALDALSE